MKSISAMIPENLTKLKSMSAAIAELRARSCYAMCRRDYSFTIALAFLIIRSTPCA